ncbi:MAG: FecR domain-containing protein [Gammaproteobacteria bacterium]
MITRQHDPGDEARDWVLRLNAPDAGPAVRDEFETWRLRSATNRAAWDDCQRLQQLMRSLTKADIHKLDPSAPRARRDGSWAAALAASLVAAVIVWLLAPAPGTWFADQRTPAGERRAFTLEDGSRVELNGATALSLSLRSNMREVNLVSGQASFEVVHDGRPFVVRAGDAIITVTGTRFDVLKVGDRVRLTVVEGHVLASRRGMTPLHVGVGDRVTWRDREAPTVIQVSDREMLAWKRGLLMFRAQPLGDVVSELSLYRRGRTFFLSEHARNQLITGAFDTSRPDAIVDAIEQSLPVHVTHLTPWLTLIR